MGSAVKPHRALELSETPEATVIPTVSASTLLFSGAVQHSPQFLFQLSF